MLSLRLYPPILSPIHSFPRLSSPIIARSSSSPRLLEAEPDFRLGTLPRVSSLFFRFSLVFRFDYERSKEDIQESEDRYR